MRKGGGGGLEFHPRHRGPAVGFQGQQASIKQTKYELGVSVNVNVFILPRVQSQGNSSYFSNIVGRRGSDQPSVVRVTRV